MQYKVYQAPLFQGKTITNKMWKDGKLVDYDQTYCFKRRMKEMRELKKKVKAGGELKFEENLVFDDRIHEEIGDILELPDGAIPVGIDAWYPVDSDAGYTNLVYLVPVKPATGGPTK